MTPSSACGLHQERKKESRKAEALAHGRSGLGKGLLAIPALALIGATDPASAANPNSSFDIYGFAQLDYIQDFKRVAPDWVDTLRPSRIAVPEGEFGTNGQASLSVKQTRFGVKGFMPTGENTSPLFFKFEFDLFGVGVDAGQTTIRLRYAYGEWGQWLAGQTTSLFMDLDIFPNVIDYWGPCGMVFLRNPQIRWTPRNNDEDYFAVAIEKPSNDVDAGNIRTIGEFAEANVQGNQVVPDLTAQYQRRGSWGHVQLAGILRDVGYNVQVAPGAPWQKGSATGWGLDLTGVLNTGIGKDQVLLGVVYGHGIASYMNDGGMDLAPTAAFNPAAPTPTLSAEAVPLTGVSAYYNHWWSPMFSTAVGYAFTEVTNTNFQDAGVFHKGQYASVNVLVYPAQKLFFGIEALWGELQTNNGESGTDYRFQVSVHYDFGAKIL